MMTVVKRVSLTQTPLRLPAAFSQEVVEAECSRSISISVDVPLVDIVYNASLLLPGEDDFRKHCPQILVLGEPITAQLKIDLSTRGCACPPCRTHGDAGFVSDLHHQP